MMQLLRQFSKEYSLLLAILTAIGIGYFEHSLVQSTAGNLIGFGILFGVIIYSAMSVAHHAEMLAEKFGEPYGTLILTISAVIVEIIIVIMMMHATTPNSHVIPSTRPSCSISTVLGIAAIIGGLKYGEQPYNIDSSNSYLSMLLVAIGIAMVLPEFIDPVYHNKFMMFNVVVFIFLYIIFTRVQLMSHRYFFEYKKEEVVWKEGEECEAHPEINAWYHSINLVLSIIVIGILAEILSLFMGTPSIPLASPPWPSGPSASL